MRMCAHTHLWSHVNVWARGERRATLESTQPGSLSLDWRPLLTQQRPRVAPPAAEWSPALLGAAAGWRRPYLSQPLAQLGAELELLGVAQTLKGQLWFFALQIGLRQFQILHLLFPGRRETKQSFRGMLIDLLRRTECIQPEYPEGNWNLESVSKRELVLWIGVVFLYTSLRGMNSTPNE